MAALHTTNHSSAPGVEAWSNRKLGFAPGERLVVASVIGLWVCLIALLAVSAIAQF